MSQTDLYRGPMGYPMVAGIRGQEVLLYQQFGSYQGEWMMLARDPETFFIYKDYYGSCSGCDSYEANFSWGESEGVLREKAWEFAKDYKPFLEVPKATMRNLVKKGTLEKIMPANIRDTYSDVDLPSFTHDMALAVKLSENMDVTADDILKAPNQELKQRALRLYGYERFVSEVHMDEIHRDGDNALLRNGDIVFAYVKDSSTPRRYLLRVPPSMTTVHDAIAWTFNMKPDEYKPLIET